jgi:predicted DsbA family dithiol-disulfide isomerase
MSELTFYFDPLCPWSWRTSRWVREVQRLSPLQVQWRCFSLAIVNDYTDQEWGMAPLRVAALAGREGGNEAVDRVYQAIGTALHEQKQDIRAEGALRTVVPAALRGAGLDPELLQRALDDPSTVEAVRADHRQAHERHGAFGVPWLVLDDQQFGFFGPVIDPVPQGQEALALWEHTAWMLTRPYLYEFKRERG